MYETLHLEHSKLRAGVKNVYIEPTSFSCISIFAPFLTRLFAFTVIYPKYFFFKNYNKVRLRLVGDSRVPS